MSAIILQHGVGDHAEMLRISHDRHMDYCQRWGFDYNVSMERQCPYRSMHFEKLALILKTMPRYPDGTHLVWMDSDTLIANTSVDLREALASGAELGMVETLSYPLRNFLNAGVVYSLLTPKTRAFFQRCWDLNTPDYKQPLEHPQDDEARINFELGIPIRKEPVPGEPMSPEARPSYVKLHPKWNSWSSNLVDNPIVRAWHGEEGPTVRRRMEEFVWQR